MKKQKLIFSSMLVLLLVGLLATLMVSKANAATQTIFEQDFEACDLVSGSGNVYGVSGGFAGASDGLSIVEQGIEGKSVKVAHEFFDDGWQKETFYKDNLMMESADAYYAISFDVKVVGNVNFIYFKGIKGDNDSQVEFNVSEGLITPQGTAGHTVGFKKVGDVYTIHISWQGNGGNSKVFFFTNAHSTDPEGDAGYYLIDNFKFMSSDSAIVMDNLSVPTEGYTQLWGTDFNDADPATVGSDAMFAVNRFAGLGESGLTIDPVGFNGTQALKGVYTFYENNGWHQSSIYQTQNLWNNYWSSAYRLSFSFKPFGRLDCGDIYLRGRAEESSPLLAIIRFEVGSGRMLFTQKDASMILGMDYSYVNGVYTVSIFTRGSDGALFIEYMLHSNDAAGANSALDSGLLIDDFSLSRCDNYVLDGKQEKIVYAQDFSEVATSVVGSAAMFGATGFAGASDGLSIDENGIDGKSLKVVHEFWPVDPDGGWQKENMYQTSRLGGSVAGNLYEMSADIKLFGSVGQGDFKIQFNGVTKASVTLRMNGTHQVNVGECDTAVMKDIFVTYNSEKQVFHLSFKFNGTSDPIMFLDYMNTTSDEGETGFYLDNFKFAAVMPKSAKETVQGTYETIFEQNFDSLVAGTTYASGGEMYNAISFAGPNDTANTVREIIADGIHNNSLKITYDFFDNNCSQGSLYLDWNRAIGSPSQVYTIYKFEVNMKTFGNVDYEIYKNMDGWIGINLSTAATWGPGAANFICSEASVANGIYHYVAYLYGTGAALTDTFEVHIVADTTDPTGLIIDDYKISKKVSNEIPEEPVIVDYTPSIGNANYELGSNENVSFDVNLKGQDITLLKIGDRVLTDSEYSVSGSKLIVNYQVLEELDPGEYTVQLSTVEDASSKLVITNIQAQISGHYVSRFSADFDDLDAGSYSSDDMFHAVGFAGLTTQVVEEGINNKSLKVTYDFWPVSPDGGWQKVPLYIDVHKTPAQNINTVYKISFKVKPFGAYSQLAFGIQFDDALANPNALIYLKSDGTYSNDPNALLIKYDVSYSDGVFTVDAYYKTAGYYLFNYWHMQRTDDVTETGFVIDDYSFSVVENPSVVVAEDIYDIVVQELPAIILNLAGFDVQHVKADGVLLVKDTDYVLTALENGNTKLELTKSFLTPKSVGDEINLDIRTTKSTNLSAKVTIVNAKPIISEKESVFELDSNKDVVLTVDLKGESLTAVQLGETVLAASDYALESNKLTIKAAFLQTIAVGSYTLTITTGDTATTTIKVSDADRTIAGTYSPLYSQDFEGIDAGRYTEEQFYSLSDGFAGLGNDTPGKHEIAEGKFLKGYYDFFPVSDGGWQRGMIYLNSGRTQAKDTNLIYKISFQVTGFGAWAQVCHGIQVADTGYPNDYLHLYSDGTYLFETTNKLLVKAEVEYSNGAFNVTLYYRSVGNYLFNFWNCQRTDDTTETGVIIDNFVFAKMDMPELISGNSVNDKAINNKPYYVVDLFGYEISSIAVAGTPLVKDTDYTMEALFGSTRVRLELTEAFLNKYSVGDSATLVVATSKGNNIELELAVVDTTPVVPQSTSVDVALNENLALTVDLKGKEIATISLNNNDLTGNEFTINNEKTVLTFKKEYLARFEVGEHEFTLTSSSGAHVAFKIVVSNSTPSVQNGSFKKGSTTPMSVTADLKGKEIVEVKIDGTALASSAYSFENGVLTIAVSTLEALSVGEHTLTLKTTGEATATITITDANPEIIGTYSVKMGDPLELTVDLHNRELTQVKVNTFVLNANEYTYNNGVLVIAASVLEELSVNTHTVTITTVGGSATVQFVLSPADTPVDPVVTTTEAPTPVVTTTEAPAPETTTSPSETAPKRKGCKGALVPSIVGVVLLLGSIVVIKRKREE